MVLDIKKKENISDELVFINYLWQYALWRK